MSRKEKRDKGCFQEYTPTIEDALLLASTLDELINDPITNSYYKLKIACIRAKMALRPIVKEVEILSNSSKRYLEYRRELEVLILEYCEKGEDGSPVLYSMPNGQGERLSISDASQQVAYYNFGVSTVEYQKRKEDLEDKYSEAIAAEYDRPETLARFKESNFEGNLELSYAGTDYPEQLSARYMFPLLLFGLIEEK